VESARSMMEAGRFSADKIARKNGFENRDRMRRSFFRVFGQSPQVLQRTVNTSALPGRSAARKAVLTASPAMTA
jgi:transcriptional regulator GlxA family with amidase domain